MEQRPNFYTILELDPSVQDWPTIETAIQHKRREWSKQKNQGTPNARRLAERYAKLLPEINALLSKVQGRKAEANAAKVALNQQKQQKQAELDGLIQLLNSQTVSNADISLLVKQTGKYFSETEVTERLGKFGLKVGSTTTEKKPVKRPVLLPSVAKSIEQELTILKLASLYDFLNQYASSKLTSRASPYSLKDCADQTYKSLNRLGKTDPVTTSNINLAGYAAQWLGTQENKDKYDNTLAAISLKGLDKSLEVVGRNQFLDTQAVTTLLEQAARLNVTKGLAIEYIEQYASKRKWRMQVNVDKAEQTLRICGFCNEPNKNANAKHCVNCGEALIQNCPMCQTPTPTDQTSCHNCGCKTGDAPLVKSLYKEGCDYLLDHELNKARDLFERTLVYWPNWSNAIAKLAEIRQRQEGIAKVFAQLQSLLHHKKYVEAGQLYSKTPSVAQLSQFDQIKLQIKAGLDNAEALFNKAERSKAARQEDEAWQYYQRCLAECNDFQPAKSGLSTLPPTPPVNGQCSFYASAGARLNWQPSPSAGVNQYQVVRKAGGIPGDYTDGKRLALVSGCGVDDPELENGVAYYYGIYSQREDVVSANCVVIGPVLRKEPLKAVQCQPLDAKAQLSWQLPAGCVSAQIWRQEGEAPNKPGEGQRLTEQQRSLTDTGLINGRSYGYLLCAQYPNPENPGQFYYSTGVKVHVTPEAPPPVIEDLNCEIMDGSVNLSWGRIRDSYSFYIIQTSAPLRVKAGTAMAIHEIDKLGLVLRPGHSATEHSVKAPAFGLVYFTPVCANEEVAMIGLYGSAYVVPDVTGLAVSKSNHNITLNWQWPKEAEEAVVCWQFDDCSKKAFSPEDIPQKYKVAITKTKYMLSRNMTISSADQRDHYITVFIKGGETIYSKGCTAPIKMGEQTLIRYQIRQQSNHWGSGGSGLFIDLTCKEYDKNLILNDLVLVKKMKRLPTQIGDGVQIQAIRSVKIINGKGEIALDTGVLKAREYVRLFFKQTEQTNQVQLRSASVDKMTISQGS